MDARFAETVEFLRARIPVPPVVGVILGSGLGDFAASVEDRLEIPYAQIPGFPASAVVGHAGTLVAGSLAGVPIVVLSGRIHYYEGHPMQTVVTPARVLGLLGCRDVVVTNAAGGIDTSYRPGDLMLIADHINLFGTNPLVGPNDETFGARFPDMSDAYRADLRRLAKAVAKRVKVPLREGVYVGVTGPSYETPAEIRAFRNLGANAVGMSTVPEVIALAHMGVGVVGVSCITNMAAGVLKQPLRHDEVLETTRRVKDRFVRLLTALVAAMGEGRSPDRLVVEPGRRTKPARAGKAPAKAKRSAKAPARKTARPARGKR
jgi:purine-nucleoside phosphorylase